MLKLPEFTGSNLKHWSKRVQGAILIFNLRIEGINYNPFIKSDNILQVNHRIEDKRRVFEDAHTLSKK